MVEVCPGISTAATLSSEPEACGLARFRKEAISTTTSTAPIAISTILAGGRFFLAVPYSSPMLMVGPAGTTGGVGGGTGVGSGIALSSPLILRLSATPDEASGAPSFDSPALCRLPHVLHGFCEFLGGQRVQHIVFGEPGAAGLQDAVADFFHVRSVVRIGVDHNLHALLLGLPQMHVVQVEAVGIGIQFHGHFVLRGRGQDSVHVEGVGVAAQLDAAGGMADDRGVWILYSFEQTLG